MSHHWPDMNDKPRWQFSFWPVLAFACVLPLLLALGAWQVMRGIEKQQVYAAFENSADIVDAGGFALGELDALPVFTLAALQGEYLNERTFLLDNMSHQGRPGHHVLTPFRPRNAHHVVMIDRGWRPGIASTADAARVPHATADVVSGRLAKFPQPGLALEGKPRAEGAWPRVVQFPDAAELSAQLQRPVAQYRLLLDEDLADGFVRDWQPPGIPPARHFAYAFQWFGLAVALIAIFVIVARPRRAEDEME